MIYTMETPLTHPRRKYSIFLFLIISLPLCLLSLSAFQIIQSSISNKNKTAIERLLYDIEIHGKVTWHLSKEIDPYQKAIAPKSSSQHLAALSLNKKGRFMMKDEKNKQLGSYQLNKEDSTLTLICQQINGRVLKETSRVPFTYSIKSYRKNILILEWQGRHGKVERHYVRKIKAETAKPII